MPSESPLAALLAAIDALRGHDSACEQRRDPFSPCYCGIARVVDAAAAVRAQLAIKPVAEQQVADGWCPTRCAYPKKADGLCATCSTRGRTTVDLSDAELMRVYLDAPGSVIEGLRAVARAVRERMGGGA